MLSCVFLELFSGRPAFQGNDEIHQLEAIFRITGTPDVATWPAVTELPWYELVKPKKPIASRLRDVYAKYIPTSAAFDAAEALLELNPARRATADKALEMPYFVEEEPKPEAPTLSVCSRSPLVCSLAHPRTASIRSTATGTRCGRVRAFLPSEGSGTDSKHREELEAKTARVGQPVCHRLRSTFGDEHGWTCGGRGGTGDMRPCLVHCTASHCHVATATWVMVKVPGPVDIHE